MQLVYLSESFLIFFGYFFIFLLTNGNRYGIVKVQRGKPRKSYKEEKPMQNYEEPFHSVTCRYENDEMARISCMATGS